jgi:hypothetical protein
VTKKKASLDYVFKGRRIPSFLKEGARSLFDKEKSAFGVALRLGERFFYLYQKENPRDWTLRGLYNQ